MERNIYLHAINATLGDTYPTIETYHILCKNGVPVELYYIE